MFNFLREDSPESSMRVSLLLIVLGCFLALISVCIYIIAKAFSTGEITHWTEMGIFATGIAAIVTGIAWQKVQQKKVESKPPSEAPNQ